MLDHVGFKVADFDASRDFYAKARAPLDYGLVMKVTPEMTGTDARHAGFGANGKPSFWIGTGNSSSIGAHIAFLSSLARGGRCIPSCCYRNWRARQRRTGAAPALSSGLLRRLRAGP